MTTPRYLTVEKFQQWARDDIDLDEELIEEAINASEEWLDFETKRQLILVDDDTVASARSYRPDCSTTLWIGDAAEIVSVVENGVTLTAGDDYQAEPLNNITASTGAYRPYERLERLDQIWYRNGQRATVTVTAKWGWESIPASVVEACKFLTQDWLTNRDIRGNVVGTTADGFSIGVRENPNVRRALHAVRHPLGYGI